MKHCPYAPGTPVAAYLRFSPGDSQSIYSQAEAVTEWCRTNGLALVRVFKDEGKSGGTTAGRSDFLALMDWLLDNVKARPVRAVVLWSLSRYAREYDDAQFYSSWLRRSGYDVFSMTDDIPEGDAAPLVEAVTFWKDAQRRKEIARDSQRGLQWLARQGYSVGGFPPRGYVKSAPVQVGYRKNGEARWAFKWELDPNLETQVREAWAMRLRGESYWKIHRATRLFRSISCYPSFFENETYVGVRKCGELKVRDAHPAYVSAEDFARVNARKRRGKEATAPLNPQEHPRRMNPENPFVLSGLLVCGYCGGLIVGNRNQRQLYYRCGTQHRQGKEACGQRSLVASALHECVSDWFAQLITYEHLVLLRDEVQANLSASTHEARSRLEARGQERERIVRAVGNLLGALERSGSSPSLEARLGELERERAEVEAELLGLQTAMQHTVVLSDGALKYVARGMQAALKEGDPETVRGLFRGVIADATLFKDKVRVRYCPPVLEAESGGERATGKELPGKEKKSRMGYVEQRILGIRAKTLALEDVPLGAPL